MRGPKPKPTFLKIVTGNAGKRALNRAEPRPAAGLPTPPAHLSPEARTEWRRVAPRLHAAGILTPIDRAGLAAYCQAWGRWIQAERAIAKLLGGLTVVTHNGFAVPHALLGIANKAAADMIRFAAEFGMTPSSRSRVTAAPPVAPNGDLAKYLDD